MWVLYCMYEGQVYCVQEWYIIVQWLSQSGGGNRTEQIFYLSLGVVNYKEQDVVGYRLVEEGVWYGAYFLKNGVWWGFFCHRTLSLWFVTIQAINRNVYPYLFLYSVIWVTCRCFSSYSDIYFQKSILISYVAFRCLWSIFKQD